jgi:glycosyltransferase involved in cell wall biosynthesis
MRETPICHYNCEMPAGGDVPRGPQMVKGWLVAKPGHRFHDVRAWIDRRSFLGLLGLPRADVGAHFGRGYASLLCEFVVHVEIPRPARLLTLEALAPDGRWHEFHRTLLRVFDRPAPPETTGFRDEEAALAQAATAPLLGFAPVLFPKLVPWLAGTLLRQWRRAPEVPLAAHARPLLEAVATPVTRRLPHLPFHGFLDHPPVVAPSQYDKLALKGWVFHREQTIRRLLATTGIEHLNTVPHGRPREEVPGRFPDVPRERTRPSEFLGFCDVSARRPNPAMLRLYAELEDGSLHFCFGQRFFQLPCDVWELPYPPFDPARFAAVRRLVQAGLRARRVRPILPLHTALAWWRARQEYRRLAPRRLPGVTSPIPCPTAVTAPTRPLRLLLATHNLEFEGAPLFLLEWARWMARHGRCTVDVVSARDGPLREDFAALGGHVHLIDPEPVFSARRPAAIESAVSKLAPMFAAAPPDLVLANTVLCFWAVHLARRLGKPSLFFIHESATIPRLFDRTLPAGAHPSVAAAFTAATRTCFLTPTTRRYYEDHNLRGNFGAIRSWIDLARIDAFRRTHSRAALRQRHGYSSDELVVANIGTVTERKGQHIFARAVAHLREDRPDLFQRARFVLVGGRQTHFQEALLADLALLGVDERLRIVPETRDVFEWYQLSDLFVCTSFEESLPRVLLEAMAFELPIVSTHVHGIPEIVEDGREARLIAPGDPLECARAIAAALDDRTPDRSTARAARRRVVQEFAYEKVLPSHLALVHEIVATASAG